MINLVQRIEAERERRGISVRRIERITGIDRCTIDNGLSGETQEMKFDNFISIVNVVYENPFEKQEIITEFLSLIENNMNVVKGLFFAQAQGFYHLIEYLIRKFGNVTLLRKYVTIFELFNLRNMGFKTGRELEIELDQHRFSKLPECQVLVNLLYGFCMYDIPNIQSMTTYSDRAGRYLPKVEKWFVKECLEMMYKERLAFIKLHADKVEESRAICWETINSEKSYPLVIAGVYCCLGESYQFECPYTAEKYLLMGIKVLEDNGFDKTSRKYRACKTTLYYIYIENGFNLDLIEHEYLDIGEEAHFQLRWGDAELGEKMYLEMEKKGRMTPHRRAARAKIKGDMEELKQALIEFERIGNIFYSNGVKKELISERVEVE
ncbi:AimR family lysis-lysogeny pheromone receptor [Bacillus cereus]|uniref:AimR family lysis-lysogeny pheromone receptor n=1 Tax=Bacillus cereus TaxID=1396 RepID=UPI0021134C4B|nr:AimR family lysis-lysogeny pheromone receptor [Bacillus cereus]MCQ6343748.1 AimR family lysis-lysogeny pheromone receptor [Bacillus cereus]